MAKNYRFPERPVKLEITNVPDSDSPTGKTSMVFFKSDEYFKDMSDEEFADYVIGVAKRFGSTVDDIKMSTWEMLTPREKEIETRRREHRLSSWGKNKMDKYNSNHANCVVKGDDVNYKNLKKGGKTCMAKKQRAKKGVDYYTVPETTKVTDHNGVVKEVPVTAHSSYTVSIRTSDENLKAHPKTRDGKARKKYYHLNAKSWAEAEELAASVGINGDRVTVTKHATTILATDVPVRKNSGTIHQWKEQDGSFGRGVNWDDGAGKTIEGNGGVPLGRVKQRKMQRNKRVYINGKNAVGYDDPE